MNEKMRYDICIAGAGAAGIFAAYAFLSSNYSVCLIDKQPRLGGTFANAWINNWIPEPNIPPFAELYDKLHVPPYQVYGDYAKSWIHKKFSRNDSESGLAFSYNSENFINLLLEKLNAAENIYIYLNAEIKEISKSDGCIESVKVLINNEEKNISAKFFIDSTGDAVLCRQAGFSSILGAEASSVYGESLAPNVGNPDMLNMPSLIYELTLNPDDAEDLSSIVAADSVSFDGYVYADGVTGRVFVNPLSGLGVSGKDVIEDYKTAYSLAVERRKQHWKKVRDELEKMHLAGEHDDKLWKGWKVGQYKYLLSKNYAPMLGVRESYRVKCMKMLTQNDLTRQINSITAKAEHFVACGNHDVDIHGFGSQEIIDFNNKKLRPYGVPLECFIPEGSCNAFVAGRCAGYSHVAASSFRINKSAAQSGWAVGNAVRLLCDMDKTCLPYMTKDGRFYVEDGFVSILQSEKYTGFLNTVIYLENNVLKPEKSILTSKRKIPVLLIIFNRSRQALLTLDAIKKYAPDELYVAGDGWRTEEEKLLCEQTREDVLAAITWDCNVHALFQEKNLGCGLGPATAITWFFENVPYGIVLEDDNVPSPDAFKVCEELLPKYEKIDKIKMINLSNMFHIRSNDSYTFIRYPEISGWASWARAWKEFRYDLDLNEVLKKVRPYSYFPFFEALIRVRLWKRAWKNDLHKHKRLTFWDYQWSLTMFASRGLCIQCTANMISNIGFGSGSHCPDAGHPLSALPYEPMRFPLSHPADIKLDAKSNGRFSRKWFRIFFYNIFSKLKRLSK